MMMAAVMMMVISISIVVAADVSGDDDGERRDDYGAFCHMVVEVVDGDDLMVIIFVVSMDGMIMMMLAYVHFAQLQLVQGWPIETKCVRWSSNPEVLHFCHKLPKALSQKS